MLNNAGLRKYEISNFARDVSIVAVAICSPFFTFWGMQFTIFLSYKLPCRDFGVSITCPTGPGWITLV